MAVFSSPTSAEFAECRVHCVGGVTVAVRKEGPAWL